MFLSTAWRTKRPADHPSYLAVGFTADCSRAFETRRSYKSPFALSNFQRLLPHYFQPQRRISQTAMNCEDCSSSTSSSSSERLHSIPSSSSCSLMTPSAKRKAGRKKFRETRHPVYRGVRARNGGKWVCEVREPFKKSRIWLGTYPNPEMAARAHDVAAVALRGEAAQLNFPELALALPRAESTSPNAIRQAAYRAAEMLRCEASTSTSSEPPRQLREKDGDAAAVNLRQGAAEWKVFVDEEAEFNMPGLLDSMAQGMLLTPLAMQKGFSWDGFECHVDLSLWND